MSTATAVNEARIEGSFVLVMTCRVTGGTPLLSIPRLVRNTESDAPPIRVRRVKDKVAIQDAIAKHLDSVLGRCEHGFVDNETLLSDVGSVVAFTT